MPWATLMPAVTMPISLPGTFAVMAALRMSINTLTLFGLVLTIGIVEDDAIVVVENTTRLMAGVGLPAREAAAKRWSGSPAQSWRRRSCSWRCSCPSP